jgi:hypothetical protein
VFAAASFEAFLTSVVIWADRRSRNDPGPIHAGVTALANALPQLERDNAQWALKLQAIVVLLSGRSVSRGEQPYQDIDLLFRIRNAFLHSKLTWTPTPVDVEGSEPHKLVKELVSRGLIDPPPPLPGIPGTVHEGQLVVGIATQALLRPEVAVWAVGAVETAMRAVADVPTEAIFNKQIHYMLDIQGPETTGAVVYAE